MKNENVLSLFTEPRAHNQQQQTSIEACLCQAKESLTSRVHNPASRDQKAAFKSNNEMTFSKGNSQFPAP